MLKSTMKHYSSSHDEETSEPGGVLPYLKMVGNFHSIENPFLTFSDHIGYLFMYNSISLTLSFCRKNLFVSITFSSRDNLT